MKHGNGLKAVAVFAAMICFAGNTNAASIPAVEAEHGMVVSSQRLASEAGSGIWYYILAALFLEWLFLLNQAALYASITRLTSHPLSAARIWRDFRNPVFRARDVRGRPICEREAVEFPFQRRPDVLTRPPRRGAVPRRGHPSPDAPPSQ